MRVIYTKNYFRSLSESELDYWLRTHRLRLIGSAVFTKGCGLTAKLVAWAEGWRCPDKSTFVPTHTGSIIEKNGETLIFDMKPPKARTQNLKKYLLSTKEDFVLILRDAKIDTKMFVRNLLNEVGRGYPYMSAIRSVFTKRETKWNCHCSELHARELQLCGYEFDASFKLECTPDELFHYLVNKNNH